MVRFKRRYLLVNLEFEAPVSINTYGFQKAVRAMLGELYGDVGYAVYGAHLVVKYANPKTNTCIITCAREHATVIRGALERIARLFSVGVSCKVVHMSGSLLKCQKVALARTRLDAAEFFISEHS